MTTVACDPRTEIDPRGPRFGAVLTVLVLALALVFLNTWLGLVLLAWHGVRPEDVLQELARREGVSGIAEKNARGTGSA